MANDMVKLGVLWKKTSREGNRPFLSGAVHADGVDAAVALIRKGGRLLVLGNNHKRDGKKDPDCELFVVPDKKSD